MPIFLVAATISAAQMIKSISSVIEFTRWDNLYIQQFANIWNWTNRKKRMIKKKRRSCNSVVHKVIVWKREDKKNIQRRINDNHIDLDCTSSFFLSFIGWRVCVLTHEAYMHENDEWKKSKLLLLPVHSVIQCK